MRSFKKICFVTLFAVMCLLTALSSSLLATPVFKTGDRIVFYGDSITEQRIYTRFIQQYICCRYPNMNLRFFNAGWSGDNAVGAYGRLKRDVLFLKPTIVTLFFGMNDGGYKAVNNETVSTYQTYMENIIKELQSKGIRVIVFTPGCIDPDKNSKFVDVNYNNTLEILGKTAIELAKKYNCIYADIFHTMLSYMNAQKAINPSFSIIPDSVHPDHSGQLFMSYHMLLALGAEPMPSIGEIDINTGSGNNLRIISKDKSDISLETTSPVLMPFYYGGYSMDTMRDSGFLKMAGQTLTIHGLTGSYTVMINGESFGKFSADELEKGAKLGGVYSTLGKKLHDAVMNKENIYYTDWRYMRLGFPDMPDIEKCVKDAMAIDNSIQSYIYKLAAPQKKLKITLVSSSGT